MAVDSNRSGSVRFNHVLQILIDIFEMIEDEKLIDLRQAGMPAKDHEAVSSIWHSRILDRSPLISEMLQGLLNKPSGFRPLFIESVLNKFVPRCNALFPLIFEYGYLAHASVHRDNCLRCRKNPVYT